MLRIIALAANIMQSKSTVKDELFLVTQHIFIIVFSNKKADQTISEVTFSTCIFSISTPTLN